MKRGVCAGREPPRVTRLRGGETSAISVEAIEMCGYQDGGTRGTRLGGEGESEGMHCRGWMTKRRVVQGGQDIPN